jgi:hypothetical protein
MPNANSFAEVAHSLQKNMSAPSHALDLMANAGAAPNERTCGRAYASWYRSR